MLYRLAADAALIFHLAFIVFALVGAFLALRWRWIPFMHLPAAAWGVFIELSGRICPLTPLENQLREAAGDSGYQGGFVEHYLVSVIYPYGLTRDVRYILAGVVLVTNLSIYSLLIIRHRKSKSSSIKIDN
jgi:hypothetical protein